MERITARLTDTRRFLQWLWRYRWQVIGIAILSIPLLVMIPIAVFMIYAIVFKSIR